MIDEFKKSKPPTFDGELKKTKYAGEWLLGINLRWHEFKRCLRKNYLSEKYYDSKAKEFYDLKMGSMIDEEYTSRFMEVFRYVP